MAPEMPAEAASETPEPRLPRHRRAGANLLLAGALIVTAAAASLWVTGVDFSQPVAAAGTAGTAAPQASPAPAPTPGVAGAVAAAASIATIGPRNLLLSADGSLDTPVTVYSDCSGNSELTHSEAAIDSCVGGRTYFVGHNSGVFTPLLDLGDGDIITWYDSDGVAHRLRIVAVRDNWLRDDGVPPLANGNVIAQFQTCETAYPDGSHDRILDAVAA